MAKKQIGRILLAKLEVAGEKSDSLSGCSQAYSLATSLLRRSQIASPESFFSPSRFEQTLCSGFCSPEASCHLSRLRVQQGVGPQLGLQVHQASVAPHAEAVYGKLSSLRHAPTSIWVLIQVQFMLNQSINIVRVKRDIRFDV